VGSFLTLAMKECDAGMRGCWAYADERKGFSIEEVLLMHILCSRRKILAVPHISSAPCQEGLVRSTKKICRRAPQHDDKTHDIASKVQRPTAYACAPCGVIRSPPEHGSITASWSTGHPAGHTR